MSLCCEPLSWTESSGQREVPDDATDVPISCLSNNLGVVAMMVAMSSRLTYRSREKLSFTSGTPQEHTSGQRQRQRQHSISITFLYYILIFIILFAYFVKMVSFDNILFYLVGSKDKYKPGTEESTKRAIRKAAKAYCVQGRPAISCLCQK